MKELELRFIGKGEVKDFIFTQIENNGYAYIYRVDTGNTTHYEIFERKENEKYGCVSYPRAKSFGSSKFYTRSAYKREQAYKWYQTITEARKCLDCQLVDQKTPSTVLC